MEKKFSLAEIQSKVKANKNQYNSFGKYNYRSAEDILEAVKQVINPMGLAIVCEDHIQEIGGRIYVKAVAKIYSEVNVLWEASAYAREEESKKGMDSAQLTGATSSYARKYALSGLFGLDDNKDSDATNKHGKENKESATIDLSKWKEAIDALHTSEDLKQFYYANETTLAENQDLMNMLSNRKAQIKK